jgi:hypothetical protein
MKIVLLNSDMAGDFFKALDYLLNISLPIQTAWKLQDIKEIALKRYARYQESLDKIMLKHGAIKQPNGAYKLEDIKTIPVELEKEIEELNAIGYTLNIEGFLSLPDTIEYPGYIGLALKKLINPRPCIVTDTDN